MANTQGSKYIFGSPATLELYDAAGALVIGAYVSPDMESYDITHEADTEEVRNSNGEVVGHIGYNNRLTLTVNFIPANTTSVANALLSAALPNVNGTCVITGAPIIEVGGYSDAINAPGTPGSGPGGRWIYAGGGSIKTTATGKATGTITLKRYAAMGVTITGAATNL
jgi:hypothetical protein